MSEHQFSLKWIKTGVKMGRWCEMIIGEEVWWQASEKKIRTMLWFPEYLCIYNSFQWFCVGECTNCAALRAAKTTEFLAHTCVTSSVVSGKLRIWRQMSFNWMAKQWQVCLFFYNKHSIAIAWVSWFAKKRVTWALYNQLKFWVAQCSMVFIA